VIRYVPPEEFDEYESIALRMGFSGAASSPFVRSSYEAGQLYRDACAGMKKTEDGRRR
jgi:lipoate synthase